MGVCLLFCLCLCYHKKTDNIISLNPLLYIYRATQRINTWSWVLQYPHENKFTYIKTDTNVNKTILAHNACPFCFIVVNCQKNLKSLWTAPNLALHGYVWETFLFFSGALSEKVFWNHLFTTMQPFASSFHLLLDIICLLLLPGPLARGAWCKDLC